VAAMTQAPHQSMPKQCQGWGDLKAAYRLLSNPDVDPHDIQQPHRRLTLQACDEHEIVLCIQDTTELDLSRKNKMRGRGSLGNGNTQGLLQHSALAFLPTDDQHQLDQPGGQLLGVLHQCWHRRTEAPAGETLRQLQSRRTDADVWLETASAIKSLGTSSARLIHVGDRNCDLFRFFDHCRQLNHGLVVRAMHNRLVPSSHLDDSSSMRLWSMMEAEPIVGHCCLTIHEQRTQKGRVRCKKRSAKLAIRYRTVTLPPPQNDPRTREVQPLKLQAVYVVEQETPNETEAVSWMLLTSEVVNNLDDALRIIGYYRHRWVIEEWHRVLKEGCRIEATHLDDARDVQRLAAIKGVIALRMLQLRDLADQAGDDPQALQRTMPTMWIAVVAALSKQSPRELTPRQFYLKIAKQGGYIGRSRDPRPGWKVLWQGWYDIHHMVCGAELWEQNKCG